MCTFFINDAKKKRADFENLDTMQSEMAQDKFAGHCRKDLAVVQLQDSDIRSKAKVKMYATQAARLLASNQN